MIRKIDYQKERKRKYAQHTLHKQKLKEGKAQKK